MRSYATRNLSTVDAGVLAQYDVAILGEMPVSDGQASMLSTWVDGGGRLIAMRPDKKLAGLLGITDAGSTMNDTYLRIDTSSGPGVGLVNEPIQWHGTADRYTLNGATAVATLYANATAATSNPAVTSRAVGGNGGRAVAFSYDLARSVVLTRQGNPAWAGRNVDGADGYEASEMFYGANGQPDWNNLDQALIPIADEQQRLLANLITQAAADRKPVPRFWYLPRQLPAAIVMTGDDHATGGTAARFNEYLAQSPAGCNLANWECIRGSSYLFPFSNSSYNQISNAQALAYHNQGFEIGVHITTSCSPWGSPANLAAIYDSQMSQFRSFMPSLPGPDSTRTHCVEWDDWATHAKVKLDTGIRYDTDYYYYPGSWTQGRPGYFNGTAIPMRYADLDGTLIDVYQGTTQVSDESGHDVAAAVAAMLDNALGPAGYYTVITANEHTDSTSDAARAESQAIVAMAKARGVPVVSGRQMLAWLDARNASNFTSVNWTGNALTFNVTGGANGLTAMLPVAGPSASLTSISRGGGNVPFTVKTIKGVSYAMFTATTGSYTANYGSTGGGGDTVAPIVTSTNPASGATDAATNGPVRFTFDEDINATTVTASSAELRTDAGGVVPATVSYEAGTRSVVVIPTTVLAASTAYTATMRAGGARDLAGNSLAADWVVTFTTAAGTPPPGGERPAQAGVFVPLTPARALDTRLLGAKSAANTPTIADLAAVGVPDDATAVALNLTVTEPEADGYITLASAGVGVPFVSNLNFRAGETTANFAVVVADAGQVQYLSTTPAHVILDVTGYWAPIDGPVSAGRFAALGPIRALDTRDGGGMVDGGGQADDGEALAVATDEAEDDVTVTATGREAVCFFN
jgi:hypothetical protein